MKKVRPHNTVSQRCYASLQDEHTVRRHFSHSRETVNDLGSGSAGLMNVLASHVLPDNRPVAQFAAFPPQVDALAETAAVGN
jgi:hypothetical protein